MNEYEEHLVERGSERETGVIGVMWDTRTSTKWEERGKAKK